MMHISLYCIPLCAVYISMLYTFICPQMFLDKTYEDRFQTRPLPSVLIHRFLVLFNPALCNREGIGFTISDSLVICLNYFVYTFLWPWPCSADIDLDVLTDLRELADHFDLMTPNQMIGIVSVMGRTWLFWPFVFLKCLNLLWKLIILHR